MRLKTMLSVVAVLLTAAVLTPVRAHWLDPLPEGMPSQFDWDQLSGYWVNGNNENYFLYISHLGLLYSDITSRGSVSSFVGRWKIVKELTPIPPDLLASLIMATDEQFCSAYGNEKTSYFRSLSLRRYQEREFITIDYDIEVFPPPNVMDVSAEALWQRFLPNASNRMSKYEGSWHHINEAKAPQWFRDQVKRLVLSGRFDCDPVP